MDVMMYHRAPTPPTNDVHVQTNGPRYVLSAEGNAKQCHNVVRGRKRTEYGRKLTEAPSLLLHSVLTWAARAPGIAIYWTYTSCASSVLVPLVRWRDVRITACYRAD